MDACPKRPIEIQVASLMRKFEAISAENKLLKQELISVKKKNDQLTITCNELKKKQDAMKVDTDALLVKQMKKCDDLEEKCTSLQIRTTPLPVPPFYFSILNVSVWLYKRSICGVEM